MAAAQSGMVHVAMYFIEAGNHCSESTAGLVMWEVLAPSGLFDTFDPFRLPWYFC